MQCFQKDHNLRVSARKLLKHPWIVNARRSDSVVPKKPTEYAEAVKSVQQWNEALKSPDASLRRGSRPMSSSPIPGRHERPTLVTVPARGPTGLKPREIAEQFRSQDSGADDNWDDDFASAISPSALQLPHLKPHDHFGGLLPLEKLKTFASFETVTEESNWDDNFEGDLTVKSPMHLVNSDPLQTVRPFYSTRADADEIRHSAPTRSPKRKKSQTTARPDPKRPPIQSKLPKGEMVNPSRPTLHYRESSIEDYSDIILANQGAFDTKLALSKVKLSRVAYRIYMTN